MKMAERFRGFLPVVLDLETGGFDAERNPLLEVACVLVRFDGDCLRTDAEHRWLVQPFAGSSIEPASLQVTGIDLAAHKLDAVAERAALTELFKVVRKAMKAEACHRAIVVAHNAAFDQQFLRAAATRGNLKRNPFHPFSTLDTATLAAVAYGHTVLGEACERAGIPFEESEAHSALYDATRTAKLFCEIVNQWPFDMTWATGQTRALPDCGR